MKRLFAILILLPLLGMGNGQYTVPQWSQNPQAAAGHSFSALHTYTGTGLCGASGLVVSGLTATSAGSAFFINEYAGATVTFSTTPASNTVATPEASNTALLIPPVNLSTGTTSITLACSNQYATIIYIISEFAGLKTAGTLDPGSGSAFASICGSGGSATNCTGSITTTNANDVIGAACWATSNLNTYTAGTNETMLGQVSPSYSIALEYKTAITTTTVTYNPGLTYTPAYSVPKCVTWAFELQ
jgi:hypothetical protein